MHVAQDIFLICPVWYAPNTRTYQDHHVSDSTNRTPKALIARS
uniref:Uncharacterized protein n=1 Tax=Anguilla anguilla TaxID=7936 RepID=A0A0E9RK58_ANGAN